MKVITVISDEDNEGYFLLKLSCAILGLEFVTLVGKQKSFTSNRYKDQLLASYIEGMPAAELILFIDGYDALLLCEEDEIVNKFNLFNKDIVFSTETNCWPDPSMASHYPVESNSPYKYLNSGGFIGKAGSILNFLNDKSFDSEIYMGSNQYLWAKSFLNNQQAIGLDYNCEIFCTFSPEVGVATYPKRITITMNITCS